MRIAIVNDLPIAVEALRRVITSVPGYQVAWVAHDGAAAVARCSEDVPDLILMDLIMPVMDGVQATRAIMQATPCAILVVTVSVVSNAAKVFEAMGFGALDAVCTPAIGSAGRLEGAEELLKKIASVMRLMGKIEQLGSLPPVGQLLPTPPPLMPVVALGSSTGGPRALVDIFSKLPHRLGAAFVVIQHVDVQFAQGLVDWLAQQTPLSVTLAQEGMALEPDTIFVAGTNDHMVIGPDRVLHYSPKPLNYPYRPSVDAFFQSLNNYWAQRGIAVLLTGIGRDGARGLLALRQRGWHTIAQDKATSVIYGMPHAALELKAANEVLPIYKIAAAIIKQIQKEQKYVNN